VPAPRAGAFLRTEVDSEQTAADGTQGVSVFLPELPRVGRVQLEVMRGGHLCQAKVRSCARPFCLGRWRAPKEASLEG
jgi:hypothetical protein